MESLAFIQWCLDHLNYWTITLLMAIESSFIPFPSEIVVPPAAYKAAAGELNIYLVVLFATLGANIGALVNYYLAMWIGRPLIYKFASSRIGHMCLIDEASVMKAEKFYIDFCRTFSSCSQTVDFYTCRACTYEVVYILALYDIRGRSLEYHISCDRILSRIGRSSRSVNE